MQRRRELPQLPSIIFPSIGNIIFVSTLAVLIFGIGNGLLYDGDTGYHIRAGEEILKDWRVPTRDIFSFHFPPLHWTAHEWLSEVIFAAVFNLSGLTGIVIFCSLLLALSHWLLFHMLSRMSANLLLVTSVTLLATATSSSHWLARPHVFSLLLTTVWYRMLDRFQNGSPIPLYFFPATMILWVNLHGGYFFALVLLALYFGGNLYSSMISPPQESKLYRQKAGTLAVYLLLAIAACGINPIGYEILLFPVKLTSDRFVMDRVVEFLSPNFHDPLPFKYMLLATIAAIALSRRRLNPTECALLALLTYMALYSARYMSLFAVIVAPLLLRTTEQMFEELPPRVGKFLETRNRNLASIDKTVLGHIWPIGAVLLVISLAAGGGLRFTFDEKRFPVAAVQFMTREPITGKMFNNDEFGDYIIFSAWPSYRVFADGRSDMYGEKLGGAYLHVANVQPGWQEILARHEITWVIFDTNSALTAALNANPEWQPIYTDKVATIFVKRVAAHHPLLARYPPVQINFPRID
jgi:hypothetical protein